MSQETLQSLICVLGRTNVINRNCEIWRRGFMKVAFSMLSESFTMTPMCQTEALMDTRARDESTVHKWVESIMVNV